MSVVDSNPFALLGQGSEPEPVKKTAAKGPAKSGRGGRGRGGKGNRAPKREFDRFSGTGRGKEVHRKGHGKGGWGKYGDELGVLPDDGTRPPRGGRRGRRGGRRGRGKRRGRGGRGRGPPKTAPADGEEKKAEGGEADMKDKKPEEAAKDDDVDFDDLDLVEEEKEEEEPDNQTLEEYMSGLNMVESKLKPREVMAESAELLKGKKYSSKKKTDEEEEVKVKSKGKRKKKNKKKVLEIGGFSSYQAKNDGGGEEEDVAKEEEDVVGEVVVEEEGEAVDEDVEEDVAAVDAELLLQKQTTGQLQPGTIDAYTSVENHW
eukprot:CAMPEP_0167755966 /NCGR_PEP_ID=MMETSP0110_2-20121227/9114_1 /TAXON_ID=629695 /ORGANISM="Gymnochlora sp., Strain CCMP2014" /LENGTH=316 /DNA_ID=CAMNT_0007642005 /DNA_START=71 /DNA_END=1019 /DNA_ORIENTATION=-